VAVPREIGRHQDLYHRLHGSSNQRSLGVLHGLHSPTMVSSTAAVQTSHVRDELNLPVRHSVGSLAPEPIPQTDTAKARTTFSSGTAALNVKCRSTFQDQ